MTSYNNKFADRLFGTQLINPLQADREFKNITLYKSDSVKISWVGYLFDIKIAYLCEIA